MTPRGSWAMVVVLIGIPSASLAIAFVRGRHQFMSRACAAMLAASVAFWYLIPGAAFLRDSDVAARDADLLWSGESVWRAVGVVVAGALALAVAHLFITLLDRPLPQTGRQPVERRVRGLALASLLSAIVLLGVQFRGQGANFPLFLLTGALSARDVLDYTNVRTAGESLIGLWEIVTLFVAASVSTLQVLRRRMHSVAFWASLGAVLLLFASSGTRSIPMLVLVAALISVVARERKAALRARSGVGRAVAGLVGAAMFVGAAALVARVALSRFRDTDLAVVAKESLVTDNDMFRELVFVLENGRDYPHDVVPFLVTPFAFTFPSFVGFAKRIPEQLVQFNFDREGIDIAGGAGNVFPGLFADGVLTFGAWGPVAIAILVGGLVALFWSVTLRLADSTVERALFVTSLSYVFLSFRNLQGSFGILLVLCVVIRRLLTFGPASRQVPHSDEK